MAVELSEDSARRLVASILAALESGEAGHPVRFEADSTAGVAASASV